MSELSQATTYLLLAGALVLPVLGALLLRALATKLGTTGMYGGSLLIITTAATCVLLLAQQATSELRIGELTLIQPLSIDLRLHEGEDQPPTNGEPPLKNQEVVDESPIPPTTMPRSTESATAEPTASATPEPTATATPEPTATATPEPTATAAPEPTATAAPEPTEEPAEEPAQRVYVVQSGDTIRAIAEAHGVSVEDILAVNGMTAEEGDQIQIGQEIIIP